METGRGKKGKKAGWHLSLGLMDVIFVGIGVVGLMSLSFTLGALAGRGDIYRAAYSWGLLTPEPKAASQEMPQAAAPPAPATAAAPAAPTAPAPTAAAPSAHPGPSRFGLTARWPGAPPGAAAGQGGPSRPHRRLHGPAAAAGRRRLEQKEGQGRPGPTGAEGPGGSTAPGAPGSGQQAHLPKQLRLHPQTGPEKRERPPPNLSPLRLK